MDGRFFKDIDTPLVADIFYAAANACIVTLRTGKGVVGINLRQMH